MAKNNKEVNVDKAWYLFKNIIDNTKRNDDLREAYKLATSPEEKAKIVKFAKDNLKQLNYAKKEIETLKEYGTVGMGKVFRTFGEKMIAEEGKDGAKILLKKIGKHLPGVGALAGIMTAFATDDASAAVPVLNEAENVGPEKGTPEYKYESGESKSVELPKEDIQAQAEAIKAMQKANETIHAPKISSPEEVAAVKANEGAIMNDEEADQIEKGIEVEKEHTNKPKIALKIALDHLKEDPRYYDHLLSMEMENPAPKTNEEIKAKGGFVDGEEHQYAGDTIDAKLNKGEMVLNIEQQQKLLDILKNKETKLPKDDRIDNKVNNKEIDVDKSVQKELFNYIKGESEEKPKGNIVKKLAEGTENVGQAPATVGLPESMKYKGPESNAQGTLPGTVPEVLPEDVPITPAPVTTGTSTPVPVQQAPIVQETAPVVETTKIKENSAVNKKIAEDTLNANSTIRQAISDTKNLQNEIIAKKAEDIKVADYISQQLKAEDDKIKQENAPELGGTIKANNISTGRRVLARVAMALGAIGAAMTGGENTAVKIIQNAMDRDLQAQKMNTETYLAKKKFLLYQYQQQLAAQIANTNSLKVKQDGAQLLGQLAVMDSNIKTAREQLALDKAKAAREQQEIDLKLVSDAQQKQRLKNIASGAKVADISELPPEMQEKAVRLPDGSVGVAFDKERARKVTEYQNEVIPAIQGAKRILETAQNFNRITDLTKRAQIASEMKALGGQLRLPFTGPGILTDKEFDRLMDTIGDPNKLLAIPSIQKAKLKTVIGKLQKDLLTHYDNAGVNMSKEAKDALIGKGETNRQLLIKRYKDNGYDENQANDLINDLIAKGTLSKEKYGI